jgi:hypothetical protein
MDSTALLSKQSKDLFSELGSRTSKTEKGMDVGSLVQSGSRDGRKTRKGRPTAERTRVPKHGTVRPMIKEDTNEESHK